MTLITDYALAWHPTEGPAFRIRLQGAEWSAWKKVSAADLAALAAIFNESPVFLGPNGHITTGPEPIGQ